MSLLSGLIKIIPTLTNRWFITSKLGYTCDANIQENLNECDSGGKKVANS